MPDNKISFLKMPGLSVKAFEASALIEMSKTSDELTNAKATAKALIDWCRANDAKFKVNDNELVAEVIVSGCYRRYHFKDGVLHNDNGPAMYSEYEGNISEYYYCNGVLGKHSVFKEKHIFSISWEMKNEKPIKITSKVPEVVCY